ncbi:MAG: hypothetical protein QW472_02385 [Candidatus Aenigmatarchaeota archaeon]
MKSVRGKNIFVKEHVEERRIEDLPLFSFGIVSKSTNQKETEIKTETFRNTPKETIISHSNQAKDQSEIIDLAIKFIKAKEYKPVINLFENLSHPEAELLYKSLKSKVLEKEILPLSTRELANLSDPEIYAKTLLFLFILKKYNFQWSFDEKETAKLISFIFFYNVKNNNGFTSALKPLKFILTPSPEDEVKSIKLDLPGLSSHDVVKYIPPMVFDYIFRTANQFAFPVIYLLFMKDNEELKKAFFTKLSMKSLVRSFAYKYTSTLERLRTTDKYKDFIYVYDEKVIKKIEFFLAEEAKEKAKILISLIESPDFSGIVHNKEELKKVKYFVEKATNPEKYSETSLQENLSTTYSFQFWDIEYETWNEIKIFFTLNNPIHMENLCPFRKRLKELGEKINKEISQAPQAFKEIDQIINEYVSIVTALALIQEFFDDCRERFGIHTFSFFLNFLDKIIQKERVTEDVSKIVERIKEELLEIQDFDLLSLIKSFLQFKREVLNIKNLSELSKLFIKEMTNYLLNLAIYNDFKEAVLKDLDRETIETISAKKYSLLIETKLQTKLKKLNLNDFDQFKKLVKLYFDTSKKIGNPKQVAFIFLLKDIVKFSRNKESYYSYIKKKIEKETHFLGYLFFIEEVELKNDTSEEEAVDLLKKVILVLNLASLLQKHLQYNPFGSFNLLYKENKFDQKQEPIVIHQISVEDVFYANLFYLLLPEYVNNYVIDL